MTETPAAPTRRKKKEKPNLTCEVLQVFRESEEGPRKYQLRVERWSKDGVPGKAKLAKRQVYTTKEGIERSGGKSGLDELDCEYIAANWAEIKPFFS